MTITVGVIGVDVMGAVGEPLLVRSSHRNVAGYPGGNSAATITNTAIHEIDITRCMFESEIIEVSWHAGKSTPIDPHRQNPQVLLLRNENDTLTVLDVFVNARCGFDVRCEVVGDTGATSLAAAPLTRLDHALQSRTAYPRR